VDDEYLVALLALALPLVTSAPPVCRKKSALPTSPWWMIVSYGR